MRVSIFVDFDDTLYLHQSHWTADDDWWYSITYGLHRDEYKFSLLNKDLIEKIQKIKNEINDRYIVCDIFMLSATQTSVSYQAKRDYLNAATSNLFKDYYTVSKPEDKCKMISSIMQEGNYEKAIMIDDNYRVLCSCQDEGYLAYSPLYFEKIFTVDEII